MSRVKRVLNKREISIVLKNGACLTKQQLSGLLGINRQTLRTIFKDQPEVEEAYEKSKADLILSIASSLTKEAIKGNTQAAIFFLKTQAGWKETSIVENNVKVKSFEDMYSDGSNDDNDDDDEC